MPSLLLSILALTLVSPCLFAQDLAIANGTIYLDPDEPPLQHATILIRKGTIVAVGAKVRIPSSARRLDCDGCVIFPGFWNAHVHFTESKWSPADKLPARLLTAQFQRMLTHSGFTTVVDTGSDIRNTAVLRRRVESGEVLGPRIYTAGFPLYPSRGIPYYLDDLPPQIVALLPQPATPVAARTAIERNRMQGADVVKLFTGSPVARGRVKTMPPEVARAAVLAAHARHQLVFAHPSNLAGVRVAMNSGVDVLAHAPDTVDGIDDAVLSDLIRHHMVMIPTLKLFSEGKEISQVRIIVAKFHKLGGSLLFGTDIGYLIDYSPDEEYRQLAAAHLSFRDVFTMLTMAPARRFGLDSHQGRIAVGMAGDLTVLDVDPSSRGLTAFTQVLYTVRGGRVLYNSVE